MKIAVIYEDKSIFVEYGPDEFLELLERYLKSEKSLKKAMS